MFFLYIFWNRGPLLQSIKLTIVEKHSGIISHIGAALIGQSAQIHKHTCALLAQTIWTLPVQLFVLSAFLLGKHRESFIHWLPAEYFKAACNIKSLNQSLKCSEKERSNIHCNSSPFHCSWNSRRNELRGYVHTVAIWRTQSGMQTTIWRRAVRLLVYRMLFILSEFPAA